MKELSRAQQIKGPLETSETAVKFVRMPFKIMMSLCGLGESLSPTTILIAVSCCVSIVSIDGRLDSHEQSIIAGIEITFWAAKARGAKLDENSINALRKLCGSSMRRGHAKDTTSALQISICSSVAKHQVSILLVVMHTNCIGMALQKLS